MTISGPLKQCDLLHRLFLSAEAPPALEKGLPISLLQNCIKLTNEPPEGLKVRLLDCVGRLLSLESIKSSIDCFSSWRCFKAFLQACPFQIC